MPSPALSLSSLPQLSPPALSPSSSFQLFPPDFPLKSPPQLSPPALPPSSPPPLSPPALPPSSPPQLSPPTLPPSSPSQLSPPTLPPSSFPQFCPPALPPSSSPRISPPALSAISVPQVCAAWSGVFDSRGQCGVVNQMTVIVTMLKSLGVVSNVATNGWKWWVGMCEGKSMTLSSWPSSSVPNHLPSAPLPTRPSNSIIVVAPSDNRLAPTTSSPPDPPHLLLQQQWQQWWQERDNLGTGEMRGTEKGVWGAGALCSCTAAAEQQLPNQHIQLLLCSISSG
ncbi:unnamed protein product [Closterium sp. Naga37s-1]|nr:unnamed protein product [Closterium sp. Naga37s-1]